MSGSIGMRESIIRLQTLSQAIQRTHDVVIYGSRRNAHNGCNLLVAETVHPAQREGLSLSQRKFFHPGHQSRAEYLRVEAVVRLSRTGSRIAGKDSRAAGMYTLIAQVPEGPVSSHSKYIGAKGPLGIEGCTQIPERNEHVLHQIMRRRIVVHDGSDVSDEVVPRQEKDALERTIV